MLHRHFKTPVGVQAEKGGGGEENVLPAYLKILPMYNPQQTKF